MFPAVARRRDIVAHRRPNTRHLIGGDAGADPRGIQYNAQITLPISYRTGHRVGKVRIVDRIIRRRTKVPIGIAKAAEVKHDLLLHRESTVVRGNRDKPWHRLSTRFETELNLACGQQIRGQWSYPRPFPKQEDPARGKGPDLGFCDHLVNRLIEDLSRQFFLPDRGGGQPRRIARARG